MEDLCTNLVNTVVRKRFTLNGINSDRNQFGRCKNLQKKVNKFIKLLKGTTLNAKSSTEQLSLVDGEAKKETKWNCNIFLWPQNQGFAVILRLNKQN